MTIGHQTWMGLLLLPLMAAAAQEMATPPRAANADSPTDAQAVIPAVDELPPDVPDFYLSKLDISGEVVEDRAELTVSVVLYLTRPDVWQTVPLRLPKATVLSREYAGTGEAAPVVGRTAGEGLTWSFRGAGRHELTLSVHVPLTRTPAGQRLEMTLPRLPEQFRGRLSLTIPKAPIEVASDDFEVRPVSVRNERTLVEGFISGGGTPAAGTRIGLRWSTPSGESPGTVATARTAVVLSPDTVAGLWRLSAKQTLRAAAGGLSVVRVRLPDGFDLVDVSGPRFAERLGGVEETSDGRWVTVRLDNSPSQTADLEWRLAAPLRDGERLAFEGLSVDGAGQDSGTVVVQSVSGYRVEVPWETAEDVRRVPASGGDAAASVEFSRQPFLLPMRVRKEPVVITAGGEAALRFLGSTAELQHDVSVGVRRGRVSAIDLEWPSGGPGWTFVEVADGAGRVGGTVVPQPDGVTVRLSEPQSEDFKLRLLARRDVPASGPYRVCIPRVQADVDQSTTLTVLTADQLEVDLTMSDESALLPLPASEQAETSGLIEADRYRVAGLPAAVVVRQTRRSTETSAGITLEVLPEFAGGADPPSAQITQQIDFRVAYGRTSDVLLQLPPAFTAGLGGAPLGDVFSFRVDGTVLPRNAVTDVQDSVVRLTLPQPMSAFRVTVPTIPVSLSGAGTGPTAVGRQEVAVGSVPLVRAIDAAFDVVRLDVRRASAFTVTPIIEGGSEGSDPAGGDVKEERRWIQSPVSERDRVLWVLPSPGAIEGVGLRVASRTAAAASAFDVRSASVVVEADDAGSLITAAYQLSGYPAEVRVDLPEDAEDRQFTWNGEPIAAGTLRELGEGGFLVAGITAADSTLGVSYRLSPSARDPIETLLVELPEIPTAPFGGSLVIRLADNHLLLQPPPSLMPRFRWRRAGLWLERVEDNAAVSTGDGHAYPFEASVFPDSVRFTVAGTRSTVLGGVIAGFAICGFVILMPQRFRLSAVLLLLIASAAVAAWFAEPARVLLQPFLFGVALAGLAWALNRRPYARPRVRRPVLRVAGTEASAPSVTATTDSQATVIRGRSSVMP